MHSGVTPQIDSGAGLGLNTLRWARVRGQGGGS